MCVIIGVLHVGTTDVEDNIWEFNITMLDIIVYCIYWNNVIQLILSAQFVWRHYKQIHKLLLWFTAVDTKVVSKK